MNNCFEAPHFYDVGNHHFWGLRYTPGDSFHEDAYEPVMVRVAEEMLAERRVSAFWQVGKSNLCEFRFLELWGLHPNELSLAEQTAILQEIIRQANDFMNDPWNRRFYGVE